MFQQFVQGDDFEPSASWFNAVNAMLISFQRGERSPSRAPYTNDVYDLLEIKNDTGQSLDRFAVVGIGDSIFDPAEATRQYKNRGLFYGVEPSYPDYFSNWAILLGPIADGAIGSALRVGRIVVNLQVKSVEHKYADISDTGSPDDLFRLVSNDVGFARILHVESGGTGD